jgi:hypothetical protein
MGNKTLCSDGQSVFKVKKNRMKKNVLLSIVLLFSLNGFSQSISGNLAQLANQQIKLEGFNGLNNYPIASAKLDEKGNFKLTYSKADYGVGYLLSADEKPLFVILSGEDIELIGEALSSAETIKITKVFLIIGNV